MRFLHLSIGRSPTLKLLMESVPQNKTVGDLFWFCFLDLIYVYRLTLRLDEKAWRNPKSNSNGQRSMLCWYLSPLCYFSPDYCKSLVKCYDSRERHANNLQNSWRPLSSNWADTKKQSENSCIPEVHRSLNSRLGQEHGAQLCGLESSIYHLTGSLGQDFICIWQKM